MVMPTLLLNRAHGFANCVFNFEQNKHGSEGVHTGWKYGKLCKTRICIKGLGFFFKLTNSEGADSFCNIILQECKCKSEYLMVYQVTAKHSCMQLKFERKNLHA